MNFIKNDRILKNSLIVFALFGILFALSFLLEKTKLNGIIVFRQFIEYIPYCLMAAAASFLAMSIFRFFIQKSPTRIFYFIMTAVFVVLLINKIVFRVENARDYDIFRVVSGVCGLFCSMVIFDKVCDFDINEKNIF